MTGQEQLIQLIIVLMFLLSWMTDLYLLKEKEECLCQ